MYANIWQIKSFLEQIIVKKQEYKPTIINKTNRNAIRFEKEETFKGNQFISFRGIMLWVFFVPVAFFFFICVGRDPLGVLIFLGIYEIAWFVFFSWQMYYFGLTKDYLIVRNHNFIWMTKIYPLSNIKEVVYETYGRMPNCMRIITKDFRNKRYPAGTLRDKIWLDLKDKLEAKGITVRNECV
jgi:hypothetical protein